MHEAAPFYITLPCDSSLDLYPKNTASEWTTKLQGSVQLKGPWEVCLAEAQYTNTLWTLQEDQKLIISQIVGCYLEVLESEGAAAKIFPDGPFKILQYRTIDTVITVPAGAYKEAKELVKAINKQVPHQEDFVGNLVPIEKGEKDIMYRKFEPKVKPVDNIVPAINFHITDNSSPVLGITFVSPRIKLIFPDGSETLRAMLGFMPHQKSIHHSVFDGTFITEPLYDAFTAAKSWEFMAPRQLDLSVGNQILYVYSSVADFSLLGSEKAQILRTLAIDGRYGHVKTERFDIGHYVPVLPSQFEKIQITIANELGENARFQSGKSLVKLHFRKYRPY